MHCLLLYTKVMGQLWNTQSSPLLQPMFLRAQCVFASQTNTVYWFMEVIPVYPLILKMINSVLNKGRKHENTEPLQTKNQYGSI